MTNVKSNIQPLTLHIGIELPLIGINAKERKIINDNLSKITILSYTISSLLLFLQDPSLP